MPCLIDKAWTRIPTSSPPRPILPRLQRVPLFYVSTPPAFSSIHSKESDRPSLCAEGRLCSTTTRCRHGHPLRRLRASIDTSPVAELLQPRRAGRRPLGPVSAGGRALPGSVDGRPRRRSLTPAARDTSSAFACERAVFRSRRVGRLLLALVWHGHVHHHPPRFASRLYAHHLARSSICSCDCLCTSPRTTFSSLTTPLSTPSIAHFVLPSPDCNSTSSLSCTAIHLFLFGYMCVCVCV